MSSETNAVPDQRRSLLDQIQAVREFAERAGWPDLARWLTAHADEPCPAAIAEAMVGNGLPSEIVALHRPITNEEHGTEPGLISGYCHRCRTPWPCVFSPERGAAYDSYKTASSDELRFDGPNYKERS